MKASTQIMGLKLADKLGALARSNLYIIKCICMGLCGFFYAQARILGMPGAFGGAAVAAAGYDYTVPTALGAVLGYLFVPDPTANLGFLVMAVGIATVKYVVGEARWCMATRAPLITTAFVTALVGAAPLFLNGVFYDWILCAAQTFLACATAYFAHKLAPSIKLGLHGMETLERISLFICGGILAAGLTGVMVYEISLGRVLAIAAVLVSAYTAGTASGACMGVALGFAVGFVTGDFVQYITLYALGGLLAGVFAPVGRMGSAASLVLTGGFVALLTGSLTVWSLGEIFAATVGFMLLPSRWLHVLEQRAGSAGSDMTTYKRLLSSRVENAIAALTDISSTTKTVSAKLDHMAGGNIGTVYDNTARRVCEKCRSKTLCWQRYYNDSIDAMNACITALKRQGNISVQDLKEPFAARCVKPQEFAATLETEYNAFIAKEGTRRKVSQVRGVVAEQFEGLSAMLREILNSVEEVSQMDTVYSEKIREFLRSSGLEPIWVSAALDSYQRMTVYIQIPAQKTARVKGEELAADLSDLTQRDLDLPQIQTIAGGTALLTIWEKATYHVNVAGCQISSGAHSVCGDTYRNFTTQGGKSHIILSDGMGSGGSAALDSTMTATLLSRLVQAGLDYESALKLVNSALLVKSGEESLATVDTACIDLYTGRTEFYKAGAAPTFVRKSGRAGSVESTSIPAGILGGVSFERSGITLREGDIVLLVSDGVSATGVDWVTAELESCKENDPKTICKHIADLAKRRRTDGREDDITVICALLQKK